MKYMMWICNNVIVNMYLVESNLQDIRYKYSTVKDEWWVAGKIWPTQT